MQQPIDKTEKILSLIREGKNEQAIHMLGRMETDRKIRQSIEKRRMREECIALEAVAFTTHYHARKTSSKTTGEIADEALAKVREWESRGDLEALYHSWHNEPKDY